MTPAETMMIDSSSAVPMTTMINTPVHVHQINHQVISLPHLTDGSTRHSWPAQ